MTTSEHFQEGLVESNGTQLYYKAFGEGEPVVILHGGPGFDHLHILPFKQLSDNFKVIFYDQRATGRSTGDVNEHSITVENFVDDLECIRKKLNLGTIHLIGHSWGSLLAMVYGMTYPDHLKSLFLLACYGSSEVFGPYFQNIQKRTLPQDGLAMKEMEASQAFKNKEVEAIQKYFQVAVKSMFNNPQAAKEMDFIIHKNTALNQGTVSGLLMNNIGDFDNHAKLSIIKCPTLVIHGDSDPLPIKAAYRVHKAIPQSKFVILQDSGHFMFIESPEALFSIIGDFIRDEHSVTTSIPNGLMGQLE